MKDGSFERRNILEPQQIGSHEFLPGDQVGLYDRQLDHVVLAEGRMLGAYPLKAGYIRFDSNGEPIDGALSKEMIVDGIPLAPGSFERGERFTGSLAENWQDPQTKQWLKAGSPIKINVEGQILDGTYLEPVTWQQHNFPAGVRIAEGRDGGKHVVLESYTIGNEEYRGGWILSFDAEGQLGRAYPVELSEFVIFNDGRSFTFTLRQSVDFLPQGLKPGNRIVDYGNREIKATIRKQSLAGIYFPELVEATIVSGKLVEVEVKENQTIRGLPCLKGCKLSINEQGDITRATKLGEMKTPAEASVEIVDGEMVVRYPMPQSLLVEDPTALPSAEGSETSLALSASPKQKRRWRPWRR